MALIWLTLSLSVPIMCAPRMSRSDGSAHVFPQKDLGRPSLPPDRRKPPRRRASAPAGDRYARPHRGFARQRPTGAVAPVRRALRCESHRRQRRRRGRRHGERGAADRARACLRAIVGRDRLPPGDRRPRRFPHGHGSTASSRARPASSPSTVCSHGSMPTSTNC